MKLYELANGYEVVLSIMEEEGGDYVTALDQLAEEFDVKAEYIAKMVLNLSAEAKACKDEADRLAGKAKTATNKLQWLKQYLLNNMEKMRKEEIRGQVLSMRVQSNPPSCVVIDPAKIPDLYWRVIPEQREPDKKAILELYRNCEEVVDGVQIQRTKSLRIR